jgi:hypothetical protein
MAGNQRTTLEVAGTVIRASADLALPLAMAQAPGMRVANLGTP